MIQAATWQQRLHHWLSDNPDDQVLRWIFRGVIAVTLAVLATDLATASGLLKPTDPLSAPETASPSFGLPDAVPAMLAPLLPGHDRRLTPMPQPDGALAKPMTFELVGGGRLMATGTITPGIFQAFATEVGKRGDYIKAVVLNSPGGSVGDALAMGRLIREKKFATDVEAGKLCASSCPLMFAGGVERSAGDKAAIGVHQVFAASPAEVADRDAMSDAQRISARCQHYLADMGIDLQVWVHAMETPKDRLFVFKPDELKSLNLITTAAAPAAAISGKPRS